MQEKHRLMMTVGTTVGISKTNALIKQTNVINNSPTKIKSKLMKHSKQIDNDCLIYLIEYGYGFH